MCKIEASDHPLAIMSNMLGADWRSQAITLHLEEFGDPAAAPVLALHGITAFGARFRWLASERIPERRWIAPDLRGHGASAGVPPWTTEQHLADIERLLDQLGVTTVDVVGHSFGGHLGLHLLANLPERVGDLALLDPASCLPPQAANDTAVWYRRDQSWRSLEEARDALLPGFLGPPREFDAEVAHSLRQSDGGRFRLSYSVPAVIAACGEAARGLPSLPHGQRSVLLVEAAPQHSTVTDALRRGLREHFGSSLSRVVLTHASHVVYRSDLDGTAAALRPFLVSTDQVGRSAGSSEHD